LNCIAAKDVLAEKVTAVTAEVPRVAGPSGTVAGAQLAAVLKSAEPGLASQVASAAYAAPPIAKMAENANAYCIRTMRHPFNPLSLLTFF
jgi:hypothetical protein